MELVLASSSRYRRELLDRLGLPFAVDPPAVDETPRPREAPRDLALRLAAAKAQVVAAKHPKTLVIGADQVASLAGRALGKPGEAERAVLQLMSFAGRRVEFLTGVAVVCAETMRTRTHLDVTAVRFRRFTAATARRYVERDRPLDCAGAIRFEGLGPLLLAAVETEDPSAAIGLPLIKLGELLRLEGMDPLS